MASIHWHVVSLACTDQGIVSHLSWLGGFFVVVGFGFFSCVILQ